MKRVLVFTNALLMLIGSSALYADETGGGTPDPPPPPGTTTESIDGSESCSWLDNLFGGCDE